MRVFEHLWLVLTIACVAWYAVLTVYITIMGWRDIRAMLRRLAQGHMPGQDD